MTRGSQRGRSQVNWKNRKIRISLTILSQLFLKYANILDVLIQQFVHSSSLDYMQSASLIPPDDIMTKVGLITIKVPRYFSNFAGIPT